MVFITEDLVRKRAEHNECEISSLEELSLHQCDVERIEHLDRWCRDLKILYLQSNLITRIEHLNRLKKLEYLNLAINSIERVENLQGCESLKKLDLTLNFIGEITSLASLTANEMLEELFLTGNPCADYDGYRYWVIATLPSLLWLDGCAVSRQERIIAGRRSDQLLDSVLREQEQYLDKRAAQKRANEAYSACDTSVECRDENDKEEDDHQFWHKPTEYTPESRRQVHDHLQSVRQRQSERGDQQSSSTECRQWRLRDSAGRLLNVNADRLPFRLDDDKNQLCLRLSVYRFVDMQRIDVDVQPRVVTVMIEERPFQLVLPEEVRPDSSYVQRSTTTGELVVSMPKLEAPSGILCPASLLPVVRAETMSSAKIEPFPVHGECSDMPELI